MANQNQIQAFGFKDSLVRTVAVNGETWFVAKDVCACLDLGNVSMAADRLADDEKGVTTVDTLGGRQEVTIISEAGLYRLIFTSRKAEAETFRRWVTHEVLPTIRKTGGYGVAQPAALTEADLERIAKRAAQIAYERLASKIPARDKQAALFAIRYEGAPDTVALWTSTCCALLSLETPRREWAKAGVAYKHYCGWCLDRAHMPINNRNFLGRLVRMGMRFKRTSGGVFYSISILPLSTDGRAA